MAELEPMTALDRVAKARQQLRELTGYEPVSVAGLTKVDSGWELDVDVVELERVPDTASLLATYQVTTDDAGNVLGYERIRRFTRGDAD
jgi:hypothetical protein